MPLEPIDAGEVVRLRVTFRDRETQVLVDPDTVQLKVELPDASIVTLNYPADITRVSIGLFERLYLFDQAGTWRWRWVSTGAGAAVTDGEVFARGNPMVAAAPFKGITAAEVKARSRVDFSGLDEPFDDDDLDELVAFAAASVAEITGRALDATLPAADPQLVPLARQAVRMRTEQLAFQAQPDNVEVSADETLESFSAGGAYSETRRGPVRLTRGGGIGGLPAVVGWPALDHLLYLLMTQDQRDFWRYAFGSAPAPYSAVTEVNWGVAFGGGYGVAGFDGLAPGAGSPFLWGA